MAKCKITNRKDIDIIINLYQNGESCTQIAKIFNISSGAISRILKKEGIEVINRQNLITVSDEDIIKDYCELKLSAAQIAKNRKISHRIISKILSKYNISIINFHNQTKFNENIFDRIDTEEKAYWLGFIFADGYIANIENQKNQHKLKYSFEISLAGKDIEHLHKFNKFMEFNGNNVKISKIICSGKEFERCRWSVGNKHLWQTLNSYGCTPNKSLTLKFPDKNIFADKALIIPFIRGYFDGDGCVSVSKIGKYNALRVSLLGTKEMLNPIIELFYPRKLIKNNDKNDITYVYNLCALKAAGFLNTIYYNATIYLDRKFNKFQNWKNCRSKVKAFDLLGGKIGESWNANPELTY